MTREIDLSLMMRGAGALAVALALTLAAGCTSASDSAMPGGGDGTGGGDGAGGSGGGGDADPVGEPPTAGTPAVFRLSALSLKDPHVVFDFSGCRDITDTPVFGISVNEMLRSAIEEDNYSLADTAQGGGAFPEENPDGLLDLSMLLRFPSYDPAATDIAMELLFADCTAPLDGTSCSPSTDVSFSIPVEATHQASGNCLGPLDGTMSGYEPGIEQPAGPCFITPPTDYPLSSSGLSLTLSDTVASATYDGDRLVKGLMRGFLSVEDAQAAEFTTPIGTLNMAQLLPGGAGNCATTSDLDTGPNGEQGWYWYLNFEGREIAYTEARVDIGGDDYPPAAIDPVTAILTSVARAAALDARR